MANHVSNHIQVRNISEAGQKVWDEYVCGTLAEDTDGHLGRFIAHAVAEDGDLLNEDGEQLTRSDMCEHIGAKWAYAEDYDDTYMNVQSAWSPVGEFVQMIAQKIGEVDPTVELILTYEDEGLNFVGVCTYDKDGQDTDNYLDYDEVLELIREQDPQLKEWWDEEECDWKEEHEEEARDLLWDVQSEAIYEWQMENAVWSTSI